jgi:hypothetical protein
MRQLWAWGLIVVLASSACGKSEAERQAEQAAEEAKKVAEAAAKAADEAGGEAAKSAEDFAKALEGLAGAMAGASGGAKADPVSFRDLQTVLPDVSGWTMGKPQGERMTSPVPFSQTEARYESGDARIDVKIVDSGFHQMLLAPWSMFLAAGYEKETDSGYEKSVTVGGNPGFEKWNSEGKDGELNLVVAKRFLVTIEGNNISDPKILHDFAGELDTAKLATLK